MSTNTYSALLEQYNNFQECTLLDYWSEDLCRTFVVLIDNIWEAPGKMHNNLDTLTPIYLRFEQCQQILINNAFSEYVINNPKEVAWSINEFSLIKTEEVGEQLHQFQIFWEDERHICIKCKKFYIEQKVLPPELRSKYPQFLSMALSSFV